MRFALRLPPLLMLLASLTPQPVRAVEWQVAPSPSSTVTWQEQTPEAEPRARWQTPSQQAWAPPQSLQVDPAPAAEVAPSPEPAPAAVVPEAQPRRRLVVQGLARDVTVNGRVYPSAVFQVPNGFAQDPRLWGSVTAVGISRTRPCSKDNLDCADAQVYVDVTPLRVGPASLALQWGVQSLSSRNGGTPAFSGQHLGFRAAVNLGPTTGLAIGGEQVVQFDDKSDLGRDFYAVVSQAVPLGAGERPPLLVATAGVGSDLYGYKGNGWLGRTSCGGSRAITSTNYPSGSDCTWGPIGSVALFLNDRISIGSEWFGYGFTAGLAVKPFADWPLTLSVLATDFLGNTPGYIQDDCPDRTCRTRLYGRLTQSF
ncbi:MAG: hypothetical protein KGQ81_04385 [Cyanobacteria bacterium REEB498]|nr:hypothetical protein [Cyanobacteria bacterium REEB498]